MLNRFFNTLYNVRWSSPNAPVHFANFIVQSRTVKFLCCVALRCVALRCVALRCVALRCVALRCVVSEIPSLSIWIINVPMSKLACPSPGWPRIPQSDQVHFLRLHQLHEVRSGEGHPLYGGHPIAVTNQKTQIHLLVHTAIGRRLIKQTNLFRNIVYTCATATLSFLIVVETLEC